MKIVRTIYAESMELIVLGAPRWRKQGLEAELEEGEDPVEESHKLKLLVDKIHAKNNEGLADTFNPVPGTPQATTVIDPVAVDLDKKMSRCKTLADLNHFAKESKGHRDIFNKHKNRINGKV